MPLKKNKITPKKAVKKSLNKHYSVKDYFANDPSVVVTDLDSGTQKKVNKPLQEKNASLSKAYKKNFMKVLEDANKLLFDNKDKPSKKKVGRPKKEVVNVGIPVKHDKSKVKGDSNNTSYIDKSLIDALPKFNDADAKSAAKEICNVIDKTITLRKAELTSKPMTFIEVIDHLLKVFTKQI